MTLRRLAAAIALAASVAVPQEWTARYPAGEDFAASRSLGVDSAACIYIAGYAQDIVMVKYRPDGSGRWDVKYSCGRFDRVDQIGIALDSSGNVIVAASVRDSTRNGFLVLKYDCSRQLVWDTVNWHSASSSAVPETRAVLVGVGPSNAIYVAGSARTDTTNTDMVLCRLSPSGNLDWTRVFDGQRHGSDQADAIALGREAVVVAGRSRDPADRWNATALRYTETGSLVWAYLHRTNSNFESHARDIAICPDGSVWLAGTQQRVEQPSKECLVVRLTSDGDSLWSRTDSSVGNSLGIDTLGNGYVVGNHPEYDGNLRVWKYSHSGQRLWRREYSGNDAAFTYGYHANLCQDQGVFASGSRWRGPFIGDFLVVKWDSDGDLEWCRFTDTTDMYKEEPSAAETDNDGNLVLTGTSIHRESGYGYFLTMKFRPSGAIVEADSGSALGACVRVHPLVATRVCQIGIPAGLDACRIAVSDAAGRRVRTLACTVSGDAGSRVATWGLVDDHGREVPNGVYFFELEPSMRSVKAKVVVQR